MDIIDLINNIQIENKNQEDLFITNHLEHHLPVLGLERLFPNGIPKGIPTMFVGDSETGKSLLSLNLVRNNPNLSFVYIDTYMQISNSCDNMFLFRDNDASNIISFLDSLDSNLADIVILDDFSYVESSEEGIMRARAMSNFINQLFLICVRKNICLILLNSVNGIGNTYNFSNTLRYGCGTIVSLNPIRVNNSIINISGTIEKSRYVDRNTVFEYQAERM